MVRPSLVRFRRHLPGGERDAGDARSVEETLQSRRYDANLTLFAKRSGVSRFATGGREPQLPPNWVDSP